jgi:O-antigen ligase
LLVLLSYELLLALHILLGLGGEHTVLHPYFKIKYLTFLATVPGAIYLLTRSDRAVFVQVSRNLLSVFVIAFVALNLLSLLWSPSQHYAPAKALDVVLYILWPYLVIAYLIAPRLERVYRLLDTFLMASILVIVLALPSVWDIIIWTKSFSVFGSTYFGVGRMAGIAFLLASIGLLHSRRWYLSLAFALIWLCGLVILILSGARTPFLAMIVAVLILLVATLFARSRSGHSNRRLWLFLGGFLVLVIVVPLLVFVFSEPGYWYARTFSRLSEVFSSGGAQTLGPRLVWLSKTYNLGMDHALFGSGLGSWPILMGFADRENYPHNLFAEVFFETGLLGLALLLGAMGIGLRMLGSWRQICSDLPRLTVFLLFIYFCINALTFNDLPGNRMVFVTLALMTLSHTKPQTR